MADKLASFDFSALVAAIRQAHEYMAAQAGRAVNISLTLRNWVIGCYIREYEQSGADRATYGENLLSLLSQRLEEADVGGCASRSLRLYRKFYLTYPEIWQTASAESQRGLLPDPIWQTMSAKFAEAIPATIRKSMVSEFTATARPTIRGSVPPELNRLLLAGMDNQLFVSKYQLELPKKEAIQRFLEEKMREVSDGE